MFKRLNSPTSQVKYLVPTACENLKDSYKIYIKSLIVFWYVTSNYVIMIISYALTL